MQKDVRKNVLFCSIAVAMIAILSACGGRQEIINTVHDNVDSNEVIETDKVDEPDTKSKAPDWSAITIDGVDESLFVEKMDEENLAYVASELQALCQEEYEDERANPEILLTQGWTRVFSSERYNNVIHMGNSAMMPLYWIIYKSPNAGLYEYICANALYELSGYDFSNADGTLKWTTSKELLELFNKEIIKEK